VAPVNDDRLLNDQLVREFFAELAEHLWKTQGEPIAAQGRVPNLVPDDEAAMLATAIEDCVRCIVVAPHEARHLQKCRRAQATKDAELKRRQQLLSDRSQDAFGVPPHVVSSTNWEKACTLLGNFDQDDSTDPTQRLNLLLEAKCAVEAEYARECRARGVDPGSKPLAADDFMPVFTFLVVQAQAPNLNTTVMHIRDSGGCNSGEGAYYMVMLEAALTHVMTLDVATERLVHNKNQMEDLQKVLEKSGFLSGGKLSDAIFSGERREATRARTKRP